MNKSSAVVVHLLKMPRLRTPQEQGTNLLPRHSGQKRFSPPATANKCPNSQSRTTKNGAASIVGRNAERLIVMGRQHRHKAERAFAWSILALAGPFKRQHQYSGTQYLRRPAPTKHVVGHNRQSHIHLHHHAPHGGDQAGSLFHLLSGRLADPACIPATSPSCRSVVAEACACAATIGRSRVLQALYAYTSTRATPDQNIEKYSPLPTILPRQSVTMSMCLAYGLE